MRASHVTLGTFARSFRADVDAVPWNIALIGRGANGWAVHTNEEWLSPGRLDALLMFWDTHLDATFERSPFWFLLCHWDAWRERTAFSEEYRYIAAPGWVSVAGEWTGYPGEIPVFSLSQPWVVCFGAQRGDPSAVLFPEAHYLTSHYYRRLLAAVRVQRVPWARRDARAVFAGGHVGAHDPATGRSPRELLRDVAAGNDAVDVFLGKRVGRARQMRYRYILDVDGSVRTWDAWAWKLMSGAAVLSPASHWETFFTRQFAPWEHYVPVAADFSDLGERIDWCRANDADCRAIAERAARRAVEVYEPRQVARVLRPQLEARLALTPR